MGVQGDQPGASMSVAEDAAGHGVRDGVVAAAGHQQPGTLDRGGHRWRWSPPRSCRGRRCRRGPLQPARPGRRRARRRRWRSGPTRRGLPSACGRRGWATARSDGLVRRGRRGRAEVRPGSPPATRTRAATAGRGSRGGVGAGHGPILAGAPRFGRLCGDGLSFTRTSGAALMRADVAQLVEHHLAKVRVAGSNPVVRSESRAVCIGLTRWSGREARQRPAKPLHGFKSRLHLAVPEARPAGDWRSLGERFPDTEEVTGSSPVSPTTRIPYG